MQTSVTSTVSFPFSGTGRFLPVLSDSLLNAFEVKDKQTSKQAFIIFLPDRSFSKPNFRSFSIYPSSVLCALMEHFYINKPGNNLLRFFILRFPLLTE